MHQVHLVLRGLIVVLGILSSSWAQAKYTVCTATINSADERDVFKAALKPEDFNFVELTDYSSDPNKKQNDWFAKACEAGVQCDVLVVSGHFGGNFFGASEYTLDMSDLSRRSCKKTCDGIMKKPKEVYLFGCNTLASKEKDFRDETSYLRALVEHGVDRVEAEHVVATRYGPFGSAFKDQMERAFEGVSLIYGFDSVGPSGPNIRPSLKKYLNLIGDYKKYLDGISPRTSSNPAWFKTMTSYNSAMGQGLAPSHPGYTIKENSCRLHNDETPIGARVDIAANLLKSQPLLYLPNVAEFVNESLKNSMASQEEAINLQGALSRIMFDEKIKEFWISTAKSAGVSPGIRLDLIQGAKHLKFISEATLKNEVRSILLPTLQNPTVENSDLVCSSTESFYAYKKYFSAKDLSNYKMNKMEEFKIADCLEFYNPELSDLAHQYVAKNLNKISKNYISIWQTFSYLSSSPGNYDLYMKIMNHFLKYRGPYQNEVYYALTQLSLKKLTGAEQIGALNTILKNSKEYYLGWELSENSAVEEKTIFIMLDHFFKFYDPKAEYSYMQFMFNLNTKALQDQLADFLKAYDYEAQYRITDMILRDLKSPLVSPKLTQALVDIVKAGENPVHIGKLLAEITLSPQQIEDLGQRFEQLLSKKQYGAVYLRHTLYRQALKGRTAMTEDLNLGPKAYFSCRQSSGGERSMICGDVEYK